jgi:hypothetical protein
MDRDLYERIRTARNGVLHLLEEECNRLGRCINVEADRATVPKIKNILGRLHNRLSASTAARVSVEELEGCDFRSIEEANERLRQQMDARNATPDPNIGCLFGKPGKNLNLSGGVGPLEHTPVIPRHPAIGA